MPGFAQVTLRDGTSVDVFEHGMSLSIVSLKGSVPSDWIVSFKACLGEWLTHVVRDIRLFGHVVCRVLQCFYNEVHITFRYLGVLFEFCLAILLSAAVAGLYTDTIMVKRVSSECIPFANLA
jgi:hypothetical protein